MVPTLTISLTSSGGITSVATRRSASGIDISGVGSLDLGNVSGMTGVQNVPVYVINK